MDCVDIWRGGARSIDCFIPFVWPSGDSMQPYQEDLLVMTGVTVTDGSIVTHLNLSWVSLKRQRMLSIDPKTEFKSQGSKTNKKNRVWTVDKLILWGKKQNGRPDKLAPHYHCLCLSCHNGRQGCVKFGVKGSRLGRCFCFFWGSLRDMGVHGSSLDECCRADNRQEGPRKPAL